MSKIIIESGMTFGPYPDDDCFELERSAIYRRIQQGVMMAEFALIKSQPNEPSHIWLVEAKSSAPHPGNQPRFDEYVDEVKQKLVNALHLVLAARLNRHREAANDLPAGFNALSLQEGFKLVLVIKDYQEAWLTPLQEALNTTFITLRKTFGLMPNSIAVINDQMARSYGLIVPPLQ